MTSPLQLSVDYWLYRDYIRRSKGEFTVAKDQYVRLNTGWFSDRSGCYLAAGRPVIIQETGFSKIYGADYGLLSFRSLAEIVGAVKAINADYKKHSRAAREIAREDLSRESAKLFARSCRNLSRDLLGHDFIGNKRFVRRVRIRHRHCRETVDLHVLILG